MDACTLQLKSHTKLRANPIHWSLHLHHVDWCMFPANAITKACICTWSSAFSPQASWHTCKIQCFATILWSRLRHCTWQCLRSVIVFVIQCARQLKTFWMRMNDNNEHEMHAWWCWQIIHSQLHHSPRSQHLKSTWQSPSAWVLETMAFASRSASYVTSLKDRALGL